MSKKSISTYEREIKKTAFKKAFDKSYKELLLSELLVALINQGRRIQFFSFS